MLTRTRSSDTPHGMPPTLRMTPRQRRPGPRPTQRRTGVQSQTSIMSFKDHLLRTHPDKGQAVKLAPSPVPSRAQAEAQTQNDTTPRSIIPVPPRTARRPLSTKRQCPTGSDAFPLHNVKDHARTRGGRPSGHPHTHPERNSFSMGLALIELLRRHLPQPRHHYARKRMVEPDGIEPTTSCLQSTRSPN